MSNNVFIIIIRLQLVQIVFFDLIIILNLHKFHITFE